MIKTGHARRLLTVFLGLLLAGGAGSSLLSVNTFPMIGNDSVVYIEHSRNLIDSGLVVHGYRQFGYPTALWLVRSVSDVAGVEPLLAMAILQRSLLVLGGLLAVRYWGWWATPLLIFLIAPGTIAYTNLILTEGLALPLALLLVFPFVSYLKLLGADPQGERRRVALILGVLMVVMATALFSIRFTYAVFGLVPLAVAVAAWRTSYRRPALLLFGAYVLAVGSLTFMISLENQREHDVFHPSADRGFTAYYYAWHAVFADPSNRAAPQLAEYYNDGVVYALERELNARGLSYSEMQEELRRTIEAMLDATGQTVLGSRVERTAWGLIGGRRHDTAVVINGIVTSDRHDVNVWINRNSYAIENGPEAFAQRYNDGRLPEAVTSDHLGVTLAFLRARIVLALALPAAMATLLVGLRSPATRLLGLTGLGVVLVAAIGHGLIWADNFRLLIVSSVFGVAAGVAVAHWMWRERRVEAVSAAEP